MKRQIKVGYVRDPAAILGTMVKVIEFTLESSPGKGAIFNQHMAGWARMRLPITLIAHECQEEACPWAYHGTIDGSAVYKFMENWVEIVTVGEIEEADLRVGKLIESLENKGSPFPKMFGGRE